MKPEQGELRLMVEDMKSMVHELGKDLAKKIGTIKELVPTDIQYQAWQEMSVSEKAQKVAEMGDKKGLEWFAAMAKMEARRNANQVR